MQGIIPRPDVAPLLQEHFVCLAADVDDCDDEVMALAANLEDAMMLPFVLVADAEGRFLTGTSGEIEPEALIALLQGALGD